MKSLSTQGIILRRLDYGEADRIITLLTSDFGKIRVIAKGVRRQKSKMAGGIELFSVSEIHFIKGKGDIDTLMSTRLMAHYSDIVKDLQRTELAYSMLKSVDKTIEDATGQDYFQILNESLAALDDSRIPVLLAELSFAMRMLQLLGHVPDFSTDAKGGGLNPDSSYDFDYESVSFSERTDGIYNKNHLKVLKLLAFNSPQKLLAVQGIAGYCTDLTLLVKSLKQQYLPQ